MGVVCGTHPVQYMCREQKYTPREALSSQTYDKSRDRGLRVLGCSAMDAMTLAEKLFSTVSGQPLLFLTWIQLDTYAVLILSSVGGDIDSLGERRGLTS